MLKVKQVHSNFFFFKMPLSYAFADVVVGGFGAPNGLGAGVEGEAGALKLFFSLRCPFLMLLQMLW